MRPCRTLLTLLALGACSPGATGREVVSTPLAPAAIGPYSQAVRVGDTLYAAGQIGLDPDTGALVSGGVRAETRQSLDNLTRVLEAAGFSRSDVVQVTIYLTDLGEYAGVNAVYAGYFPGDAPARATVEVARLPRDARVEILLVADRRRP